MPEAVLTIRPFTLEDTSSFFHHVCRAPDLWESLGFEREPSVEEASQYIQTRVKLYETMRLFDFAVELNCEVIGEINAAITKDKDAAIGYVIAPAFRKQGYGFAGVQLLFELLRKEGIRNIYGACRPDNSASIRLMEKAGMRRTEDIPEPVLKREADGELIFFVRKGEDL